MKNGLGLKGQISIFIILGTLLVFGVIGFMYLSKIKTDSNLNSVSVSAEDISPDLENLESNILMCIYDTGSNSLDYIGKHGGYYNKPSKYLTVNSSFVPYYYYEGELLMPTNYEITRQLEYYIDDNFGKCLDDLNKLNLHDFKFNYTYSSSKVIIGPRNVTFFVDSLISIQKEDKTTLFSTANLPVTKVSALGDILEVSRYITDSHKLDSKMYCINCLAQMAEDKNLYVWQMPIYNNSLYVVIGENSTSYKPYLFNFLNKYSGTEISNNTLISGNISDGLPGGISNE